MTTVTLRFDDATKRELDEMVEEMGMNLTTFFTIYAKKLCGSGKYLLRSAPPQRWNRLW